MSFLGLSVPVLTPPTAGGLRKVSGGGPIHSSGGGKVLGFTHSGDCRKWSSMSTGYRVAMASEELAVASSAVESVGEGRMCVKKVRSTKRPTQLQRQPGVE